MKKSDLKKLKEGSCIYDGIDGYEVTKIYKSRVQYYHEWKNDWGEFGKFYFVSYAELLNGYWKVI